MLPLYEFLWSIFNNRMTLVVGAWAGLPLTVLLLIMFVRKKNRDERGWKIIGKASVISFLYFIVVANLLAKTVGTMVPDTLEVGYFFCGNVIQWLYDTMILIEIIAILIFRKIE
ncbi:MAG: hypothetical protein LUE11_02780 [Clostridia bacterium]|nr:hypothetical protein [Clostridia bacterium]